MGLEVVDSMLTIFLLILIYVLKIHPNFVISVSRDYYELVLQCAYCLCIQNSATKLKTDTWEHLTYSEYVLM
jgi:hypothetical protein